MKSGREIPAYAGMTWVRDGYDGIEGAGMTGGGGNDHRWICDP